MVIAESLCSRRKLFVLLLGAALTAGGSLSCATHAAHESAAGSAGSLHAADLRCEYRFNPVGVDELHPRLSWIVQCDDTAARDKRQSAYQILVASSREFLACGNGDLWDSGKVASDATNQIAYAGKDLFQPPSRRTETPARRRLVSGLGRRPVTRWYEARDMRKFRVGLCSGSRRRHRYPDRHAFEARYHRCSPFLARWKTTGLPRSGFHGRQRRQTVRRDVR